MPLRTTATIIHPVVNTRHRNATKALSSIDQSHWIARRTWSNECSSWVEQLGSNPNDSNCCVLGSRTKFETTKAFGFTSRATESDDKRVSSRRSLAAHDSKLCL